MPERFPPNLSDNQKRALYFYGRFGVAPIASWAFGSVASELWMKGFRYLEKCNPTQEFMNHILDNYPKLYDCENAGLAILMAAGCTVVAGGAATFVIKGKRFRFF